MIRVSYISYVLLWFPSNIFFKQQTSTMNHHIDLRSWFAAFVVWIDRHGFLVASVGLCAFGVRMPGRIPENPPAAAKHRKNVAIILHLKSQSHRPFTHHWPLLTIDQHWPSLSVIECHWPSLTIIAHYWPLSFSIGHEVPWNETPKRHTSETAPWLQVAIVLAQLCTVWLLPVSLWHDQTWEPAVWRLRAKPWGHWGNSETAVDRNWFVSKKKAANESNEHEMFALTGSFFQDVSTWFNISRPPCFPGHKARWGQSWIIFRWSRFYHQDPSCAWVSAHQFLASNVRVCFCWLWTLHGQISSCPCVALLVLDPSHWFTAWARWSFCCLHWTLSSWAVCCPCNPLHVVSLLYSSMV